MSITKICKSCQKKFKIRDKDLAFYEKVAFPSPKLCQPCREKKRFLFRNERHLYRRKCDLCGSSMITIYSQDKSLIVYCQKCWWSDKWDAFKYGRDFDFNKPFFEQFKELLKSVPRYSLYNVNGLNSEYCQQVVDNKDCYLCFVMKGCDSCMYMYRAVNDKNCVDCSSVRDSELCYECTDSNHIYNCSFCEYCKNSSDLKFCYDLINCQNCFGCVNLRNKQYHIFNKSYSKEEYEKEYRKQITLFGLKQFADFKLKFPHKALWNINNENSLGDNLTNTKNCYACFDAWEIQDCSYCTWIFTGKDYYDCYGMGDSELVYESIGDEEVHSCAFTTFVTRSHDVYYSDSCFSSSYLFGCAGIKHNKYAILNKIYPKEIYDKLKLKIIEHMKATDEWGEFFPADLSPFHYNETIAQFYYPIIKEH